jgi:hypothetical protein
MSVGRLNGMSSHNSHTRVPIPTKRRDGTTKGSLCTRCRTVGRVTFLLLGTTMLGTTRAEPPRVSIAVLDFNYSDTSGEEREQSAYHEARLQDFARTVRTDLEQSGRFRIVPITCQPDPCSLTASDPAELVGAARRAGARLLLFGGIHKMSTLVQWAKAQVIDVQTQQLVFDRLMTFRGDDVNAWQHAETFLVKDLTAQKLVR